MKFKVKVDLWIKFIFYGSMCILIIPVFTMESTDLLIYLFSIVPISLFILWLLLGSYIELRDNEVFFKLGPIRGKIPYNDIKSVSLSNSWSSSWALTSKRVTIKIRSKTLLKGDVQIGPLNRNEFIDEITYRCKNLD